jgi:hypothetical protein
VIPRQVPGVMRQATVRQNSRQTWRLTAAEAATLRSLPFQEGAAFKFWREVALARGLDYRTIIGNPSDLDSFTAMPDGHGRDWCWPDTLKCTRSPVNLVRAIA